MEDQIDLVVEHEEVVIPGISGPVLASIIVHVALLILVVVTYKPPRADDKPTPITRYVELIKQNPRDFVEAPGRAVDKAPITAPWSDANRKASIPTPTGEQPTNRPGDGHSIYRPPMESGSPRPPQQSQQAVQPSPEMQQQQAQQQSASAQANLPADLLNTSSRIQPLRTTQAAAGEVNWHSVIKEVGKVATLGGNQSIDLGGIGGEGGDKGFAEQGPLSFETQWYDWGGYAAGMVSRIRINWYDNMPPLIRTGMKGVVTIRFTIQRNGQITNVEIITSSGVPPYDFAAKKAIELSSPLNPLPKDFPNSSERVTCMFFYNSEPPSR